MEEHFFSTFLSRRTFLGFHSIFGALLKFTFLSGYTFLSSLFWLGALFWVLLWVNSLFWAKYWVLFLLLSNLSTFLSAVFMAFRWKYFFEYFFHNLGETQTFLSAGETASFRRCHNCECDRCFGCEPQNREQAVLSGTTEATVALVEWCWGCESSFINERIFWNVPACVFCLCGQLDIKADFGIIQSAQ